MMGVASRAIADDLGHNPGPTTFGMTQAFEHEHTGTLTQHEAIPIDIKGA
jgi:hypothetical protein